MCTSNVPQCSEYTPLSTVALASLLKDAGFPSGVFNVVAGDGSTGAALTAHKDISKISFTGSVPTGKRVRLLHTISFRIELFIAFSNVL